MSEVIWRTMRGRTARCAVAIIVCLSVLVSNLAGPGIDIAHAAQTPHHHVAHMTHHDHHGHAAATTTATPANDTANPHSEHEAPGHDRTHDGDCDGLCDVHHHHCCLALIWPTTPSVRPPNAPRTIHILNQDAPHGELADLLDRPPKHRL
ncbi:MAG: hypothetical protein K0U74_09645 [Alphaproteobacteria bacterium]|nr:hypothetical protein [Alphaproteobacteria bacterium]